MNKAFCAILTTLTFICCSVAHGQEFVPATSEDIDQFDQQLARQIEKQKAKAETKDSTAFGKAVAEEAKKLKDADKGTKREFGAWVSSQRGKSDSGRPAEAGSGKSGKDKSKEDSLSQMRGGTEAAAEARGRGRREK